MINLEKIKKAHQAISPYINRTPLILSNYLSKDRIVKLKLESLQITNSFKLRGATNKLLSLDKPTSKAIPYNQWTTLPEITFENNIYESLYNSVVVYNPVEPNPPVPLDVVPKSSTETMSSTKKGFNVG